MGGSLVIIEIRAPEVGRRRLIATAVLCTIATVLWIGASAYLPFAKVSGELLVVGFAIPWGVGYVTLLLMEQRITRDLQRVSRRRSRERVGAR